MLDTIERVLEMESDKQKTMALGLVALGLAWFLSLMFLKGDTTNDQE